MSTITRAQFLRGNWHRSGPELRPPWALAGVAFAEKCTGCGGCIKVCPTGVISLQAPKHSATTRDESIRRTQ